MMNRARLQVFIVIAALALAPHAHAGKYPDGFSVLPSSVSPDGRYGVLVPDEDHYKEDVSQNKLIETATGKVIAVIEAETGMEHMNHGGADAVWSKDGSLLHWIVEGKWFPRANDLLKLRGISGPIAQQVASLDQLGEAMPDSGGHSIMVGSPQTSRNRAKIVAKKWPSIEMAFGPSSGR